MRQFTKQTIIIYSLVFLICMGIACKEIEYVEPFRWGTMQQNFNLKGQVASVIDSIYDVEYLLQTQTYIEHPENKQFLFKAEGTTDGYPTFVAYKGYDDYTSFPLDTAYTVNFFIDPSKHIFSKANVIINGQTFNGVLRYPSKNRFSLLSGTQSERIVDILDITYDESFRIIDYSSWTSISIVRRRMKYSSLAPAEGGTGSFDLIIASQVEGAGTIESNSAGLIEKITIVQQLTNRTTEYTYIYSDFDSAGNYRKVEIRESGIIVARIERNITYH